MTSDVQPVFQIDDIVMVDAAKNPQWGGCLVVVEDVAAWGVLGRSRVPSRHGMAYVRLRFDEIKRVGRLGA